MELGLALPQYDWEGPVEWEGVVEHARWAEELGFDSVWLADHLFLDPERYGQASGRVFGTDPIVGLAAIARATEHVKIGTLVICAQLRPAAILAKMLATLNDLSDGRLIAGIGAGWYEAEFAEAGVPFERPGVRVRQLEDTVTTIKERSPDVAVWVAGKGDRVLEVAARHADGFNHQGWTSAAGPYRFDEFRATCERVGRDPSTITVSALQAVEDVDALPDQLSFFAAHGVVKVIVSVGPLPFAVTTFDALQRVASARP